MSDSRPASASGPPDQRPLLGVSLMFGTVLCWTALDVSAKWLGEQLDVGQIIVIRSIIAMAVTLVIARTTGGSLAGLATRRPLLHLARSLFSTTAVFSWFIALQYLPIADAITLAHASPLIVTALSIVLLGESVRPLQWLFLLIGFAGVIVVAQPGGGADPIGVVVALFSTLAYAGLTLTARRYGGEESNLALAFWLYPTSMVVGFLWAGSDWRWLSAFDTLLLVSTGVSSVTAFYLINAAVRHAPIATIAPVEYTALVWGGLAGWLIWGDVPGATMLAGAALIICSGIGNVLVSRRGPH